MTQEELNTFVDENLPSNEKLTAEELRDTLKVIIDELFSSIQLASSGLVVYIDGYRTIKGDGNNNTSSHEDGDEIIVIDPTTRKRSIYYVHDSTDLTLPTDFDDDSKVDLYPPQNPVII